jgi:hypothetical protein
MIRIAWAGVILLIFACAIIGSLLDSMISKYRS